MTDLMKLAGWRAMATQAVDLAASLRPLARQASTVMVDLDFAAEPTVALASHDGSRLVAFGPQAKQAKDLLEERLRLPVSVTTEAPTWELLAEAELVKVAYSPFVRGVGQVLNFFPSPINRAVPGLHSPIGAMVTSGLLGGGLGYGLGALGEKVLPEFLVGRDNDGRLRRTLALLGALPGMTAGGYWMLDNINSGKPFNSNALLSGGPGDPPEGEKPAADFNLALKRAWDNGGERWMRGSGSGVGSAPGVEVNYRGQVEWGGGAENYLNPQSRGALDAVTMLASQLPGQSDFGLVSPLQVARLGVRLGVGYGAGRFVGNVLGTLTGLPPSTQRELGRVGVLSAVTDMIAPKLFGG